jgi:hypothetical protein
LILLDDLRVGATTRALDLRLRQIGDTDADDEGASQG